MLAHRCVGCTDSVILPWISVGCLVASLKKNTIRDNKTMTTMSHVQTAPSLSLLLKIFSTHVWTDRCAREGTCTWKWQETMTPLQLEEIEHMSQAMWLAGSSTESPLRFVDVSFAPCPLLVWWYPLSGNDGAFCLPSKGLLYFLLLLNGSQQLSCKTSECHQEINSSHL